MKYLKLLNLIPLGLFVILDIFGKADIDPKKLIIVVVFVIMNIFVNKSMKEYLLSSLMLFVACVGGKIIDTYYYYYNVSSDFETPIVGAFVAMVYGITVLVVAGVGTAIFALKNRKAAPKNDEPA